MLIERQDRLLPPAAAGNDISHVLAERLRGETEGEVLFDAD